MTRKIKINDLPEFDMAEHLPDAQAVAEYLTVVLEENNPAALADALGTIARARGMSPSSTSSIWKTCHHRSGARHERHCQGLRDYPRSALQGAARGCQPAF